MVMHCYEYCGEVSIPFTRSTYPPFILNGLPLRQSSQDTGFHHGFNEHNLRSYASTQLSGLYGLLMSTPLPFFFVGRSY